MSICTTTKAVLPTSICRWAPVRSTCVTWSAYCWLTAMMRRLPWRCSRPIRITWHTAVISCNGSGPRNRQSSIDYRCQHVPHLGRQLIRSEGLGQKIVDPDLAETLHDLDVSIPAHGNDEYLG